MATSYVRQRQFNSALHTTIPFRKNILSTEFRYQIYLLIKEAINNAVKYSEAKLISMKVVQKMGCWDFLLPTMEYGIDVANTRNGNGLKNMQDRASQIGASFLLRTTKNAGTEVFD
jgi:signal transduction histidine kinase